ncbi:MAG: SpoIVB peptidase S55, partial [Acidobacteriota bacterium]
LSQVHRGLTGTAWTVFQGSKPEPIPVQILGVLRGARGPGQDMILAKLGGAKAEYTGVVEGMSGSPVYIGDKLLGSLSYRIGQFSKDPIAGITPIQQMLTLRNLPSGPAQPRLATETPVPADTASLDLPQSVPGSAAMNFQAIETPLVMSGFSPDAIRLWQQRMAGTGLDLVAAGGMGSGSSMDGAISHAALTGLKPGSAISAQLVRGDVEIAATCTITYIDPKQLLACGHPVLQAGPVSLPMTTADVVTTLASPLNAFKIINTGATVGAFTEDRESGIRGILGAQAHMIPMLIEVDGPEGKRHVNVEVLDLPSLTSQAVLVVLYDALLESNESTAETSYHVTGSIGLSNYPPSPLDVWASAGGLMPAPMDAALQTGQRFTQLYSNDARRGAIKNIDLHVQVIPRRLQVQLVGARLVSGDLVHAGETITVEATLRPWQQAERNVRIPIMLPARLNAGTLRILVSDGGTLDRTLNQPQLGTYSADMDAILAQASHEHPADKVYVSLLPPEAQAGMDGRTLTNLPLSMANALEPVRSAEAISLNGESAELAGEIPAGGILSGFQLRTVHIQPGGGLN